jgi:hypothetical protein
VNWARKMMHRVCCDAQGFGETRLKMLAEVLDEVLPAVLNLHRRRLLRRLYRLPSTQRMGREGECPSRLNGVDHENSKVSDVDEGPRSSIASDTR